ncbi:hypothetical protein VNO78_03992 [Psophocarpus tetragonolobus]|uniref:Uncharacterized protein n=1 Tax=Psophocarpus tetragonolobus TaxID=3891 RepID=A0AAN9T515_PSOTE
MLSFSHHVAGCQKEFETGRTGPNKIAGEKKSQDHASISKNPRNHSDTRTLNNTHSPFGSATRPRSLASLRSARGASQPSLSLSLSLSLLQFR